MRRRKLRLEARSSAGPRALKLAAEHCVTPFIKSQSEAADLHSKPKTEAVSSAGWSHEEKGNISITDIIAPKFPSLPQKRVTLPRLSSGLGEVSMASYQRGLLNAGPEFEPVETGVGRNALRQEGTDEQLLPLTHGGLLLQLVSVTLGS